MQLKRFRRSTDLYSMDRIDPMSSGGFNNWRETERTLPLHALFKGSADDLDDVARVQGIPLSVPEPIHFKTLFIVRHCLRKALGVPGLGSFPDH